MVTEVEPRRHAATSSGFATSDEMVIRSHRVVGTAVFATLEKSVSLTARIGVAGVSVIAAVLSALQTFLRFKEG